jgi:hypothetical protein
MELVWSQEDIILDLPAMACIASLQRQAQEERVGHPSRVSKREMRNSQQRDDVEDTAITPTQLWI